MNSVVEIPTLTTERLVLRTPMASDFEAYAASRAAPRTEFLGGPEDRIKAVFGFCALFGHWQMLGFGRWIVADRQTDAPLGIVGLFFPEGWPEAEIAWSLFDNAEGRGFAFEAAFAARAYAYDTLGWTTAISCIAPGNTRSLALAARMGAVFERDFVHDVYGPLPIYRHPSPSALAAEEGTPPV